MPSSSGLGYSGGSQSSDAPPGGGVGGGGVTWATKLMKGQGWEEGKGLGREEAGRTSAIKVDLRFDTRGVSSVPRRAHLVSHTSTTPFLPSYHIATTFKPAGQRRLRRVPI